MARIPARMREKTRVRMKGKMGMSLKILKRTERRMKRRKSEDMRF